ncbi:hypothetical protein LTR91_003467 [Friedmanniomyces endolithicus]|uniref:Uncharacterized protein n=1 Tax=Friedmanniomyces endolithicus TaxID=329885 RepID=A0AAN6KWY8_9PEZI|nr:hypothetical protein LTR94_001672 [Friedmanniomyces endolithicus]KAK0793073.1 hypothetical protein LTR75_011305 [Friedmanniomyces endolithicus]KAK0800867.1 hypothetical protein LTR38_007033 [Friedmanniomyces endolithicus]KAK0808061.1 hypothetical protein LTR59_003120 [Friedmanniomyces endolithicus]KAK0839408.1 hypothetical protein LTR03_011313 [Friedmanniomyces endolithicus]
MPTHVRLYSKDEELGKRDDDFKPRRGPTTTNLAKPWRWRKRRLLSVIALLAMGYVFFQNIPVGLGLVERGIASSMAPSDSTGKSAGNRVEPTGAPTRPRAVLDDGESSHYYDGPIKFYRLASTLHAITHTFGLRLQNLSSLQSAANLMPMACEMAKWDRNYVHMAFLGRDALSVDDILDVNGFSRGDCAVNFHDARSDYSKYSIERRAEVSVSGAMKHINDFMHPQAIIMDDSELEDAFFVRAMRYKTGEMGRALIEIPAGRYEDFLWMTRLDSGSLSNWFKPTIEILIHAPLRSSGGLIRLVRSLEDAEYAGFAVPRMIVELPADIDHFAKTFLKRLQWPRKTRHDTRTLSTLTLRRRVPSAHLSSEQASIRFVESFYPSVSEDNHVLVLSAQAEISPLYLHYLHYVILEYKYSSYTSTEADRLLGVSLDIPTAFLNGSGRFAPPSIRDMRENSSQSYLDEAKGDQPGSTPFLYQAPSATASLFFGDKWIALHDFLTNRLASSHRGAAERTKKFVSEAEPAWLEYLLELTRARGWTMLYPATPFVTIHNELSQIPEEYLRESDPVQASEEPKDAERLAEEAFLLADESPVIVEHVERETPEAQPLQDMLPFKGDLPELPQLPSLSYTGDIVNATTQEDLIQDYVPVFRRTIGGCRGVDATRKRIISDPTRTDDLFCFPGVDIEFDMSIKEDGVEVAHDALAATAGPEGAVEGVRHGTSKSVADGVPKNGEEAPVGVEAGKAEHE